MITQHDPGTDVREPAHSGHQPGRGGHGWMMIACCIPMLAIAVVLVATGAASPAFLAIAVGCTLMMVMMIISQD